MRWFAGVHQLTKSAMSVATKRFAYFGYLSAASILRQGVLALVLFPVIAAKAGDARFGSFMIAMSFSSFVMPILTGGITAAIYRTYRSRGALSEDEFWGGAAALALAINCSTVLLFILTAVFMKGIWNLPTLVGDTIALGPYLLLYSQFDVPRVRALLSLDSRTVFFADLWFALGSLAVIPLLQATGAASPVWVLAFAAGPAVGLAYLLLRVPALRFFPRWSFTVPHLMGAAVGAFTLANFGTFLTRSADRWVLASSQVPVAKIGYYVVAVQASMLLLFPVEQAASGLFPIIANVPSLAGFERRQRLLLGGLTAAAAIGVLIAGLPIGWLYFKLLYSDMYRLQGWPVFKALLPGVALFAISIVTRTVLLRFASPRAVVMLDWLGAVLLIVVGSLVIGGNGLVAMAWARTTAFAVLAVGYAIMTVRLDGGHSLVAQAADAGGR
jgi:O-antigen/teichoic acid export membrane protein